MKNTIEQTIVPTKMTYDALVTAFEDELGRWDADAGDLMMAQRVSWDEAQRQVSQMTGRHGLMIMLQLDTGAFTSLSGKVKRCSLYLVGNPVIASRILDFDPRAAFYVPFRVCLFDNGGPEGASLVYDRPSSFLATLDSPELVEIGVLLDGKIDGLARTLSAKE